MWLDKIYYKFGTLICHQIADRTLYIGGKYLPVCARDAGIYIGMFLAFSYLLLKGRWNCDKPPALPLTVMLCLFFVPMGLDGISSYSGLRLTNNLIRILTGGFFGLAIPFFLVPIKNFKVYSPNTHPSLESYKELLILIVLILTVCSLVYNKFINSWWLISTIIIFTILVAYFIVCYTIIVQIVKGHSFYVIVLSIICESTIFGILCLFREYVYPILMGQYRIIG